ncbi:hypothetical protein JOE59_001291 [Agromyces cerinus]|uniref:hypothetical protein n=1 Tax=Agromyces cerinus TaxID=33878 RepID=UPI00195BCBDC|nr:hypothetical protein [Agromyces cerinus]MBM7830586.1 hypothetical protein [Agromyces cerinus]
MDGVVAFAPSDGRAGHTMAGKQRIVWIAAVYVSLVAALGLTGCAPATGAVTPSAAGSTSEPVEASDSPTVTTPPAVESAPCDAVLDKAGYDDLAADNLTLRDFDVQSWDYPLLAEYSTDGMVCKWTGGGMCSSYSAGCP